MTRAVGRGLLAALLLAAVAGCQAPLDPVEQLPGAEPLPDASGSWMQLGRSLLAAGQPEQAEAAFIRSLRVEGMSAAALTGAGVAAQRQGLLTEAKRYFERAKEIDPESVAVHNNLGAAFYGLGELQSARQSFRIAFALSSGASQEAGRNLQMAELAIERAEAENPPLAENPIAVQRMGSGVYRLTASPEAAGPG